MSSIFSPEFPPSQQDLTPFSLFPSSCYFDYRAPTILGMLVLSLPLNIQKDGRLPFPSRKDEK